MNRLKKVCILALTAVLALGVALPAGMAGEETVTQVAMEFLRAVFDGQTEAAEAQLDGPLRDALAAQGGLEAVAASLAIYGAVTGYGEPTATTIEGGFTVVMIPLLLEEDTLNAQVTLNENGLVAGLYFLPAEDDPLVARATALVKAMMAGEYDQMEAAFTPMLQQAIDAGGGIAATIDPILAETGPVLSYGNAAKTQSQGMWVVVLPLSFAESSLNAIVSFDDTEQVAGLLLQPIVDAEIAPLPDGITEEEVTVDAGTGYPVGGTLCLPDAGEKRPAVLLVTGSGNNPRDEVAGANRVFAQLAHGLAERGIITLRVDKRTYTHPDLWQESGFTVQDEYIEDVLAAFEALKADERVDASRVYIAGHSQGAMLAPRFVHAGADVDGLILLAGTPRNLSEVLYDQEMSTLGGLADEQPALAEQYAAWKAEAEAVYAMDKDEALAHEALYGGAFPAYYLYDLAQYDALALLKEQKTPVLILQGAKDMQIYADTDFALFQQALEGESYAQLKLYEGLNHMFMPSVAETLSDAMTEYNLPNQIPEEVFDDIATFIMDQNPQP